MTAPSSPGIARALRSPVPYLLIPTAIILAAAVLTPASELRGNQGDVSLYLDDAERIVDGGTPYVQVPLEYPPLALVPMIVPYLSWPGGHPTLQQYAARFAAWESLLVLALGFVLVAVARAGALAARGRDPGWAIAWRLPILVAGAALAITWRFDVFAALLLAVSLWATLTNRPIAAGIALGLGVLAKLFPIVAAPALAVAWLAPRDGRRLARFGIATGFTIAAGLLPFLLVADGDALSFLSYHSQRGLEVESIGAGVVLLDGLIRGQAVETSSPFKAVEVFGPLAKAWLGLLPILTIGGFGTLALVAWRRVRIELAAHGAVQAATLATLAGASLLLLLITSKVFSIQYVVWLLPFAALLRGRPFWLAAAVVALTMPIHPFLFSDLIAQRPLPILVLNLRNALLVALTGWLLIDLWRAGAADHQLDEGVARPAGLEPTTFRSAT